MVAVAIGVIIAWCLFRLWRAARERSDRRSWEAWNGWLAFCRANGYCIARVSPHRKSGSGGRRRSGRYATLDVVGPEAGDRHPAWFQGTQPKDKTFVVVRRDLGRYGNVGWGSNYAESSVLYVYPERQDLQAVLKPELYEGWRRQERRRAKTTA